MSGHRPEIAGKVQTVLGVVDAEDLGITLPHEHLLVNMTVYFSEPEEAGNKKLAHQPVSIENLSWLQHHPFGNPDNMRILDEELATEEAMLFKIEGGNTIVEVSNRGLSRDPLGLARISRATGLNIIMGSGYYIGQAQDPGFDNKTEDEITEEIITDIEVGVGQTGIRAGIIGEIGASWPLIDRESKSLRAAVRAQKHTGAAINIHQVGMADNASLEIIKTMDDWGADISRVAVSHTDLWMHPSSSRLELAKTGCYLEWDLFGHYTGGLGPCDRERIEQIIELINEGHLKQILIAQDHCLKTTLLRYGGHGYAHILRNIVPLMLMKGITREQINTILVENPKRLLQFV